MAYTEQNPGKAIALMAQAAGIDVPTAMAELKGYRIYGAKDQSSLAVLGAGSDIAQSATSQSLANTAAVLLKIGRITAPLGSVPGAIDPSFAIQAAK